MKATKVLIIYVCVLLLACLVTVLSPKERFTNNNIYSIDPSLPDNQLCGALVKQMFPDYTFSEKAKNVIGTLKPDVTTTYSAIGIEPNMNFQCVIPNTPLNSATVPTADGSWSINTSSDLQIFNINVNQRYDGQLRCVGKSSDGSQQVDMPYRDDKTSLPGCTISIPSYKDRPQDFEKELEALHDISREEYVKMMKIKQQERDEAMANKSFWDNVNNKTLQQATRWEQIANSTKNDTKELQTQIDNINAKISAIMARR